MVLRATMAAGCLLACCLAAPGGARGERLTTREALERLEEILEMRLRDGTLARDEVVPAFIVSTRVRYEESQGWFETAAASTLARVLPREGLRVCQTCLLPRTSVGDGRIEQAVGPMSLDEIIGLDDRTRGTSERARSAIWLDEHLSGVGLKIVELSSGRILFAQNVDPQLAELKASKRAYMKSAELERRARGDSITQAFFDAAVFPGQHIALDFTEQWGTTNANLSGVVISALDPVVGLGVVHYRVLDFYNVLVGGKLIASVPSAIVRSLSDVDEDVVDPLVTAVFVLKVPFGSSNYGALFTASTNGAVGIGLSLMNVTLLPLLP